MLKELEFIRVMTPWMKERCWRTSSEYLLPGIAFMIYVAYLCCAKRYVRICTALWDEFLNWYFIRGLRRFQRRRRWGLCPGRERRRSVASTLFNGVLNLGVLSKSLWNVRFCLVFSAKNRRKLRRILLCYSHIVLFDFAQPAGVWRILLIVQKTGESVQKVALCEYLSQKSLFTNDKSLIDRFWILIGRYSEGNEEKHRAYIWGLRLDYPNYTHFKF